MTSQLHRFNKGGIDLVDFIMTIISVLLVVVVVGGGGGGNGVLWFISPTLQITHTAR